MLCKNVRPAKRWQKAIGVVALFVVVLMTLSLVAVPVVFGQEIGAQGENPFQIFPPLDYGDSNELYAGQDGDYIGIVPAFETQWRFTTGNLVFWCYYTWRAENYYQRQISVQHQKTLHWGGAPAPTTVGLYFWYDWNEMTFPQGWIPWRNHTGFGIGGRLDMQWNHYAPAPMTYEGNGRWAFHFRDQFAVINPGWQPRPATSVFLRPIPPTITKSAVVISPASLPLQPGDIIEYTLTITNTAIVPQYQFPFWSDWISYANFDGFIVEDILPPGLEIDSGFTPEVFPPTVLDGVVETANNTIRAVLNLYGTNQTNSNNGVATLTFRAIVTEDAPECGDIVNIVTLDHPIRHFNTRTFVEGGGYVLVGTRPYVAGRGYFIDYATHSLPVHCPEPPPPPPPCRDYITPEFEITKNLSMPTGAVPPNRSFNFEIDLVALWFDEPILQLPNFTTITRSIPFTNGMGTPSGTATFDFNHVDWFALRPSPGFYTFRVREVASTSNPVTDSIIAYDPNVFYVFIQVGWICDGEDDLGIMYARTQRWLHCGDSGCPTTANHDPIWPCEAANCTMDGLCADCTPCVDCGWGNKGEDIIFQNVYIPLSPLEVRKQVTGNFGNRTDLFDMSIRLTLPQLVPAALRGPITGGIYRYGSNNRVPIDNILIDITLTSEPAPRQGFFEFELRHGDRLVLDNVPIGTTYIVTEYFVTAYDQTAFVTEAGITGGGITPSRFPPRQNLVATGTMRQRWVPGTVEGTGTVNSDNNVLVVNHLDQAPPLGVFVNNAPFVGLMVLAGISGVLGFLRLRKPKEEFE